MLLSEKYNQFNCKSLECSPINDDFLLEVNSKIKGKPKNLFFENNISLESAILPTKDSVFIGAYSYMNDGGYIRGPTFIGRFCSIGRRVTIGAGTHSIASISSHPLFSIESISSIYSTQEILELNLKERRGDHVYVGSDVWVGDGVVILAGVKIGTGSVIGANSVITKDVDPYSIVGGIPSKLIKKRFPAEITGQLIESRWWDKDLSYLKNSDYKNVNIFLKNNKGHIDDFTYDTFCFK
jgi:acetyltransferase-like isoleucine patch superfamily enzyme